MKLFIYLFTIVGIALLAACSDYNKFEPYDAMDGFEFLSEIKPLGTYAQIDPGQSHTLITSDSILLEIGPNAFIDEYGMAILDDINIVFTHVNQKYELLAHEFSLQNTLGNLLEPLAIFRVDAYTEAGDRLKMDEGRFIKIKFPMDQIDDIPEIFCPAGETPTVEPASWKSMKSNDLHNKIFTEGWTWKSEDGQIRHSKGFIIYTNLVDWILIGDELVSSTNSNIEISFPELFDESNSRVFLYGNDSGNIQLLTYDKERHKFCNSSGKIPQESDLNIVAFSSIIDNKIFISSKLIEPNANVSIELNPGSYSVDEALEVLLSL